MSEYRNKSDDIDNIIDNIIDTNHDLSVSEYDNKMQLLLIELVDNINIINSTAKYNKNYVYIIKAEHGNFYKIGRSCNPIAHLSDLQVANHGKLQLIVTFCCTDASRLESEAHKLFETKNIRGEWFELSLEELYTAIQEVYNLCDNINNKNKYVSTFIKDGDFKYVCDFCNYQCYKKSSWLKHQGSIKHKENHLAFNASKNIIKNSVSVLQNVEVRSFEIT